MGGLRRLPEPSSPAPLLKVPGQTLPFPHRLSFPTAPTPLLHSLAALVGKPLRKIQAFQ